MISIKAVIKTIVEKWKEKLVKYRLNSFGMMQLDSTCLLYYNYKMLVYTELVWKKICRRMFVLWMALLQEGRRNIDLETKFLSVKKCFRRLIQRKLVFEKFFLEVNTTQHPKSYPEYRQPIQFQTTSAPSSIDMTRTTGFFQHRPSSKYPTTN